MINKFENSRDWVKYHLPEYGREWVASHYETHKLEIKNKSVNPETFSRYIRQVALEIKIKEDIDNPDVPLTDYDIERNQATFTGFSAKNVVTLEDAVDYAKIDTTTWEVIRFTSNHWGNGGTNQNYQIRVECKKRTQQSPKSIWEDFKNDAINYIPKYPKLKRSPNSRESCMIEISVPDLHFGLLAQRKETLDSDYNIEIAEKIFLEAIESLLITSKSMVKIDKILFPIGNDFFNVNSSANTTFKGTPQSEDKGWKETFTKGRRIIQKAIEMMIPIADIEIVIVPGNHDTERAFYLGEVLDTQFKKCNHVAVDNSPSVRKYITYGMNLIGYMHQVKKIKLDQLPLIMAEEVPQKWANSKYREIHLGHLHKEKVDEIRGVKVISLPSLVSLSEWASSEGYSHLKEAQVQIWTKEKGKKSTLNYYPSM